MLTGDVALEGFTDTLSKELNPAWNIKVRMLFEMLLDKSTDPFARSLR